jgi:hypothetical protein
MYLLNKQQLVRISGAGNAAAVGAFLSENFAGEFLGSIVLKPTPLSREQAIRLVNVLIESYKINSQEIPPFLTDWLCKQI